MIARPSITYRRSGAAISPDVTGPETGYATRNLRAFIGASAITPGAYRCTRACTRIHLWFFVV